MGQVVSFEELLPTSRHDDVPWTAAQVYEAIDYDGPWTLIDTITFEEPDDDPSEPSPRSITTSQGSLDTGLWYRVVFIDDDDGQSLPTDAVQNATAFDASRMYMTPEALKASLAMTSTDFADEDIKRALPASCRAIDDICGRFFYLTGGGTNGETRLYTRIYNPRRLDTDDIVALSEVSFDINGDGVYETALTLGPDYVLEPANAPLEGKPWEQILLRRRELPRGPQAIRLTGRFGWAEVPAGVVEATSILAARFVKVIREASFGVYVSPGLDTATATRLGRTDPHVMMALNGLMKTATVA